MKHLVCDALVHVLYSRVSGQCSHTTTKFNQYLFILMTSCSDSRLMRRFGHQDWFSASCVVSYPYLCCMYRKPTNTSYHRRLKNAMSGTRKTSFECLGLEEDVQQTDSLDNQYNTSICMCIVERIHLPRTDVIWV